jgi:polysaccharide pyruvyl transferase WcaK-like protein
MRILIEPNAHHHLNAGDAAMLQVAFRRLRELFPEAVIQVITEAPERLDRLCPGAEPVPAAGRRIWFNDRYFGDRLHRRLPGRARAALGRAEDGLRRRWPAAARAVLETKGALKRTPPREVREFLDAVGDCDALVVGGAGAVTDPFAPLALTVLELVETAADRGVPVALFGQGIGPIEDRELWHGAAAALPRASLIALREGRAGPGILRTMGVRDDRVEVTGDDALELAYAHARDAADRSAIGLSARVARYSGVDLDTLRPAVDAVTHLAERRRARLISIPISAVPNEADDAVIGRLTASQAAASTGMRAPRTPEDLMERILCCRVVVTGSYHAGVFALAVGIPTVGLVGSPYYAGKFEGLAHQFGRGCAVVSLGEADAAGRVAAAVDELWDAADEVRPSLVEAAGAQVASGRAAYRRFAALLDADAVHPEAA